MVDTTSHMTPTAPRTAINAHPRDFIELMKPRVMSLVVFTAWIGMMIAPGDIHILEAAITVVCIAIAAGASGAMNMWYDADIDAVMNRTKDRPIPSGRVHAPDALAFGLIMAALSVILMGLATNWVAAGLLAFSVFFYVAIYTMWLKRSTPQNIVIGGAAGAFPPTIGWAAVTGDITFNSLLLFLIIFMWTPPHFWALGLFRNDDYTRANVPMLPVVAGERHTKLQMIIYSVILAPLAVLPAFTGLAGTPYLIGSSLLGLVFVAGALAVWREDSQVTDYAAAKRLFGYSIFYLFMIFLLLLADHLAQRVL